MLGMDVEALRKEILETPGLVEAAELGATSFSSGEATFRLARHPNGHVVVTTIIDVVSPSQARSSRAARTGRFSGRQGNHTKSSAYDARQRRATLATEYEDEDELAGDDCVDDAGGRPTAVSA